MEVQETNLSVVVIEKKDDSVEITSNANDVVEAINEGLPDQPISLLVDRYKKSLRLSSEQIVSNVIFCSF